MWVTHTGSHQPSKIDWVEEGVTYGPCAEVFWVGGRQLMTLPAAEVSGYEREEPHNIGIVPPKSKIRQREKL